MSDSLSKRDSYDALIGDITAFYHNANLVRVRKEALNTLSSCILDRDAKIAQFERVFADLKSFLDAYDFSKGYAFDALQEQLNALSALCGSLEKMGAEAKKIASYPDYYGAKRAVDICRELTIACKTKLHLNEISRFAQLVEANIQRLLEIQKRFEGDGFVLDQLRRIIEQNASILNKYPTYYGEITQYISTFPHQGEDSLSIVSQRIEILKEIDGLMSMIGNECSGLRPCCNRHHKDDVVREYDVIANEIFHKLLFANASGYKAKLTDLYNRIQKVVSAFASEKGLLLQLQGILQERKPVVWKEEGDRLLDKVRMLLGKDYRTEKLNADELQKMFTDAQKKRKNDIDAQTTYCPWLLKADYCALHEDLISKYITYEEYKNRISEWRKARTKKILKVICWVIGIPLAIVIIVFAFKYIIGFIAGIIVLWVFFKVLLH